MWDVSKYLAGLFITCAIGQSNCWFLEKCYASEPFLSTLQNTGVKFLQGVENFQQGEVLFVQAAYKFLHAAKMHFMQL